MIVKDWMNRTPSLFNELTHQLPDLLGGYDADALDILFSYLYGERKVAFNIQNKPTSEIVGLVILLNRDKWESYKALMDSKLEAGAESQTTRTATETNVDTRTLTSKKTEQTSAYNEVDLSTSGGDEDSTTEEVMEDHENTHTETVKTQDAWERQRKTLDENFARTLCEDIARTITISIY